jgi:hypothetical protein
MGAYPRHKLARLVGQTQVNTEQVGMLIKNLVTNGRLRPCIIMWGKHKTKI